MITETKVYGCDGCGHRSPATEKDDNRPVGLIGLGEGGAGKQQGVMGTVDVPTGDGERFETKPWYAHKLACVRAAIANVLNDMLPPRAAVADETNRLLSTLACTCCI